MTAGPEWDRLSSRKNSTGTPLSGAAFRLPVRGGEEGRAVERIRKALQAEPVLCVSALCALASMALTPPSAAYLGYVDLRVLILRFSLMAVVAGARDCGVFEVLAQRLLSEEEAGAEELKAFL